MAVLAWYLGGFCRVGAAYIVYLAGGRGFANLEPMRPTFHTMGRIIQLIKK
jgi:hypothetical protein